VDAAKDLHVRTARATALDREGERTAVGVRAQDGHGAPAHPRCTWSETDLEQARPFGRNRSASVALDDEVAGMVAVDRHNRLSRQLQTAVADVGDQELA